MKRFLLSLGLILAVFIVHSQTITITSPNGGEVWEGCTTENITWTDSGTSNFYSIDYSVDNGSSWTSIATFYNTTSGSYTWTIPNIQSTQALIRVQDSNNALVEDISNVPFSMIAPLILLSPNGGETWQGGTTQTIQWVASNTSNEYELDYSVNGGNTWISIDNYFSTTGGTFNWQVPNNPSPSALVRVRDYNNACKSDQSNQLFELSAATSVITVGSPSAGSTIYTGGNVNITWSSEFVNSNQVQIEYSPDGGSSWITVAAITENDGVYSWPVPSENTTNGLIRITDLANPATFDVTNEPFSILDPFIIISSPTAGDNSIECQSLLIEWSAGGVNTNRRYSLQYSINNGDSWVTFANNYYQASYTNAAFNWNAPTSEGDYLIRVSDYYNSDIVSEPVGPIEIINNTSIIVTYPNGGETLTVGETYTITWADVISDNIEIDYSIDGGVSWIQIDSSDPSDGAFTWTVPDAPTTQALIRINDDSSSCIEDESDSVFTIAQPESEIINVNPGNSVDEIRYTSLNWNVTWTSFFVDATFVSIDYSTDSGNTWTNLTPATENDGSFAWPFDNITSETMRLRVTEVGGTVSGESEFDFSIRDPFIIVSTPTAGDNSIECQSLLIEWSAGG
ncbi:MAG: hypothetical protein ACPGWM_01435, partial [Flavobacteriales bacterium]